MLKLSVKSTVHPYVTHLVIEEGNIDLSHGMRCIVRFLNKDQNVINNSLFQIDGDEFQAWVAGSNGHLSIIDKLLKFTECQIDH